MNGITYDLNNPEHLAAYLAGKGISSLTTEQGRYVIVRSNGAGVFAGHLESEDDATCTAVLTEARRLWYWKGAASLSQLAVSGPSEPKECKFPCIVPRVKLQNVLETLDVTEVAKNAIEKVPVWKA